MAKEFRLKMFSRRWGHEDFYTIARTSKGWSVHHLSYQGECNRRGEPILYKALGHDSINYPAALGDYLEHLWNEAEEGNASEDNVQEALDELGEWISACEKASPTGFFADFK